MLGGLPRSGITLLSSILNQNPIIYVTTSSPFVEILWRTFNVWEEDTDVGTHNIQESRTPFLRKLPYAYYSELTDKPIIIDKRRQWQGVTNIELYEKSFGVLPKIICPVRSCEDIVASYVNIYKKNNIEFDYDKELTGNRFEICYNQLKDAFNSGYRDCFLLVEYNDLVEKTEAVLEQIYKFIDIPLYEHNLDYVFTTEPEANHGINGLHDIRHVIEKSTTNSCRVLGDEQFSKFQDWNFWRK